MDEEADVKSEGTAGIGHVITLRLM
jgi:hypothetical protein